MSRPINRTALRRRARKLARRGRAAHRLGDHAERNACFAAHDEIVLAMNAMTRKEPARVR